MSLETCIIEAKKWAEENSELKLRPADIEYLGRLVAAANDAGVTPPEKMSLMQLVVDKKILANQLAARGEKYLNSSKHVSSLANIIKNIETWKEAGHNKLNAAADAFWAHVTGEAPRPGIAVNNDPLAARRGAMSTFFNALENSMPPKLLKVFKSLDKSDRMTFDIIQELDALRNKGQSGLSGNDMALQIARHLRGAQDFVFGQAKALNPYLKENELYLFSRSHTRDLISKAGVNQWVEDAMATYGNALIGDVAKKRGLLTKVFKEITSGLPPEGNDRFEYTPGDEGSRAKKLMGSRVFVANDWKAEAAYNAKYGDSLYNSYMKQSIRMADYVANTNKWGTKPPEAFAKLFQAVADSIKDPAEKVRFLKNEDRLKEGFESTQARRGSEVWTRKGQAAQALMGTENLSMLGNHSLRVMKAPVAAMSQIRDAYGLNIFEQVTQIARGMGKVLANFGDAGASEMQRLGGMSTSVSRDVTGQIAAGRKGVPLGATAKVLRLAGKLTLADWTTNAYKTMMLDMDTRLLGDHAGVGYDKLNVLTKELLSRYNLHGPRWEVLRQGLNKGRITPSDVMRIPDEHFKGMLGERGSPKEILRSKTEMAQDLGTMLNDRASHTVGESSSASRAKAYGLADLNTAPGIVRYWLTQFRQASMVQAELTRRTYRSGGGNTSNISGTLQLMVGSMFMGMIGRQAQEIAKGREPLNLADHKILGEALRESGIFGFYGDIVADLLQADNPFKEKSLLMGSVLGPSFGTLAQAGVAGGKTIAGLTQAVKGESWKAGGAAKQYGGAEWAKLLNSLTPDQNVFYLKAAIDYMFMNEIHEFMSPNGYLGHLRAGMQKSKNISGNPQQFWGIGGKNYWE